MFLGIYISCKSGSLYGSLLWFLCISQLKDTAICVCLVRTWWALACEKFMFVWTSSVMPFNVQMAIICFEVLVLRFRKSDNLSSLQQASPEKIIKLWELVIFCVLVDLHAREKKKNQAVGKGEKIKLWESVILCVLVGLHTENLKFSSYSRHSWHHSIKVVFAGIVLCHGVE